MSLIFEVSNACRCRSPVAIAHLCNHLMAGYSFIEAIPNECSNCILKSVIMNSNERMTGFRRSIEGQWFVGLKKAHESLLYFVI